MWGSSALCCNAVEMGGHNLIVAHNTLGGTRVAPLHVIPHDDFVDQLLV